MKPTYTVLLLCQKTLSQRNCFVKRCGFVPMILLQQVCYGLCSLGAGVECATTCTIFRKKPAHVPPMHHPNQNITGVFPLDEMEEEKRSTKYFVLWWVVSNVF